MNTLVGTLYFGLFAVAVLRLVLQRKYKPKELVSTSQGIAMVLSHKDGWVEVLHPQLEGNNLFYRTEPILAEKLSRPLGAELAVMQKLAPLLLERQKLQQQQQEITDQQARISGLLGQFTGNRQRLLLQMEQQVEKLAAQIAQTLADIDDYVREALLSLQLHRAVDHLGDPIALYSQQQQIQLQLETLRTELKRLN